MCLANASCAAGLHHMLLTWAAAVGTEHVSVTATLAQTGSEHHTRCRILYSLDALLLHPRSRKIRKINPLQERLAELNARPSTGSTIIALRPCSHRDSQTNRKEKLKIKDLCFN